MGGAELGRRLSGSGSQNKQVSCFFGASERAVGVCGSAWAWLPPGVGDKGHGTGVVFENVHPRKAKLGFVNLCRLTC